MFQKILFLLAAVLVSIQWSNNVLASLPLGWGKVAMMGSIIDSACAIDTTSRYQAIDMGVLPVSNIVRDGEGEPHAFTIQLINCTFTGTSSDDADWKYFQITFGGNEDNNLFALQGDTAGIALQITDSHNNKAQPGVPLPKGNVDFGKMSLEYNLRIVSNHKALRAGQYTATIPFKMDYY